MNRLMRAYKRLYGQRRFFACGVYGLLAAIGYVCAYLLRFEFAPPAAYLRTLSLTLPVVVGIRMVVAWVLRLSSGRWRFISTADVLRLFMAMLVGSGMLVALREVAPLSPSIPKSVLLIEWVVTSYLTAGVWLAYRLGFEWMRRSRLPGSERQAKRALLVGAGEAGNMLAREIQRFPTGYKLVGFVDDDPNKLGCRLQGVDVIGGTDDLGTIVAREGIEEIILAVPSAGPEQLRRLVEQCEMTRVPFKVLPGIAEVLAGKVGLGQLRKLRVEDLLGRDPVELELPELAEDLRGKVVLITGAAGSIGSELSRQVALHRPRRMIVLDQAETDLFFLELELREAHPDLPLVPVIADVADEPSIRRVFARYRPDRVFHAAAYKHVPLMETNAEQAVKNNVMGTALVADAAGQQGAEKFVLVSTDKAVRPANVMGSTKRMAELVVLEMQDRHPGTAYGAVRFGNVLGSQGSVLPIFQRQVRAAKPLTITHPEVTRYFMTIPEAVQLILQASLLPEFRGRIAMLDMGKPVKILDLAANFLRLSGIPVRAGETYRFTGLRPGEKLHEELAAPHEGAVETSVPKIRLLTTYGHGLVNVGSIVERWSQYLADGKAEAVEAELRSLFKGLNGRLNGNDRGEDVGVDVTEPEYLAR